MVQVVIHQEQVWFPEPEPAPVPVDAERTQCLLALFGDGTTPGITEAMILAEIEKMADPVEQERSRLTFYRPRWRRDSTFIAWGQATFGLTDAQVDDLFRLAATL